MAEQVPQSFDYATGRQLGFSDEQLATMAAGAINYDMSNALQAGLNYSEIINLISLQMPQTGGTITPAPPPPVPIEPPVEGSSFLRQTADIPLSIATGVSQGIRMLTDAFGANNPISRQLSGLEDTFASLLSAQGKNDKEEIARILEEVEDMGMGAQLRGAFRAFIQAPLTLTSQAFGTIVPVYVTGLATTALKLGAVGTRAAIYGTAITQGVGLTKDAIYETVSSELINAGVPEEAAAEAAKEAQGYLSGGNLDMIGLGGVLGAVALRFGAEAALLPNVFKKLNPALTAKAAEQLAKQSTVRKVGATAVREAIPEAFQGTGEQLARNLALRGLEQADLDRLGLTAAQIADLASTPVGRGLVSQGALEGMVGVPVGGLAGYVRARKDAIQKGASPQELRTLEESLENPEIAAFVEDTRLALEEQYAASGMPQEEVERLVEAHLESALIKEFNRIYGDVQSQVEGEKDRESEAAAATEEYEGEAREPLRIDEGQPYPPAVIDDTAAIDPLFPQDILEIAKGISNNQEFLQGFMDAYKDDEVVQQKRNMPDLFKDSTQWEAGVAAGRKFLAGVAISQADAVVDTELPPSPSQVLEEDEPDAATIEAADELETIAKNIALKETPSEDMEYVGLVQESFIAAVKAYRVGDEAPAPPAWMTMDKGTFSTGARDAWGGGIDLAEAYIRNPGDFDYATEQAAAQPSPSPYDDAEVERVAAKYGREETAEEDGAHAEVVTESFIQAVQALKVGEEPPAYSGEEDTNYGLSWTAQEAWETGTSLAQTYAEDLPEQAAQPEATEDALTKAANEAGRKAGFGGPAFTEGFLEGYAQRGVPESKTVEKTIDEGWSIVWGMGFDAGRAYEVQETLEEPEAVSVEGTTQPQVAPAVRTKEGHIDYAIRKLSEKRRRLDFASQARNPYDEGSSEANTWAEGFNRAESWSTAASRVRYPEHQPLDRTPTNVDQIIEEGFNAGLDFYAEYGERHAQEESWNSPETAGTQIPSGKELSLEELYTDATPQYTKLQRWGANLFGMRKSNAILGPDSELAGKDISNPEDAGVVKRVLERWKNSRGRRGVSPKTQDEMGRKIDAYLGRSEFTAAVAPEAASKVATATRDPGDFDYTAGAVSRADARDASTDASNDARVIKQANMRLDKYQTRTDDILKGAGFVNEEEFTAYAAAANTEVARQKDITRFAKEYTEARAAEGTTISKQEALLIGEGEVNARRINFNEIGGKLLKLRNALVSKLAEVQDITVNPLFKGRVYVQQAKDLLADERIGEVGITPDMINEAHRTLTGVGTHNLKALPTSEETDSTYNPAFEETATGTAALNEIIKNGNPFEQILARLLRPFLAKTKIKIVRDPAVDIETETLREEFGKGIAMYASSTDTIYLGPEAVNNTGVLHEAVHGATAGIITSYIQNPLSVSEEAALAIKELIELNVAASEQYYRLKKANKSNAVLDILADKTQGNIFSNSVEFLAYGQTQEEVQELLLQTPATLNWRLNVIRNGESQFVNIIRRMLRLPMEQWTGMEQLLDLTDRLAVSQAQVKPKVSVIANAKKAGKGLRKLQKTQALQDDIREFAEESIPINEIMTNRKGNKAVNFIDSIWEDITASALSKLVYTYTNTMLNRQLKKRNIYAGEKADQIERVNDFVTKYKSDALKPLEGAVTRWQKFNNAFQKGSSFLADLIHLDTIHDVLLFDVDGSVTGNAGSMVSLSTSINTDPKIVELRQKRHQQKLAGESTVKTDNEIRDREDVIKQVFALKAVLQKEENGGQEGIEIFKATMTKYYNDLVDYHQELTDQITKSSAPRRQKERLLAEIQLMYEEVKKLRVYAPLMRYGKYGLRIRKQATQSGQQGATLAFLLFDSRSERNRFEKSYRRDNPDVVTDRETVNELVKGIRKDVKDSSQQLQKINKMLGELEVGNIDIEAVKEQAYQMYLRGLPQGNLRRKFLHRRNIPGYSNNALQNYVNTQLSTINQMARLKYSSDINNRSGELDALLTPDIIRDSAELEKQRILAREVKQRAIDAVYTPVPEGGVERTLDWFTRQGSKSVFYYMLSSVRSAVIQPTQLLQFGYPTLAREYGRIETIKVMGEYLKVGNKFGRTKRGVDDEILDEKGQMIIRESKYVQNHPDKKWFIAAWDWANDVDLFGSTRVSSILETQSEDIIPPGSEIAGGASKATKFVFKSFSFMFHHMERMSREVMFMSSFELAWAKAQKKYPNTEEGKAKAFKEAAEAAVEHTNQGMFNYTQYNKPSAAKRWYGRLPYQFMSYRLQATAFMWRSFYDGLYNSDLSREESRKALHQFLDVMGISVLLSGITGMFGYTATVALVDGIREVIRPDFDDDDRDLFYDEDDKGNIVGKRSFDLYIRNNIIPRYFGAESGMAQLFGISPEVAEWITEAAEYGLLSALTQSNWSVSTSLDGMWFKSTKPEDSYEGFLANTMYDLTLGPFAALTKNVAKGMQLMVEDGDILRGAEYMLPGLIKEPMEAARLWREGLVTLDGRKVTPAEYYQGWRIVGQALGFNNLDVQRSQDSTFLVKDMVRQGEELYASLLEDHSDAAQNLVEMLEEMNYDFSSRKVQRKQDALQEVRKEIVAYNWKYFYDPISDESLVRSYEGSLDRAGMTVEGLYLPDKLAPYFYGMIAPSRLEPFLLRMED